MPFTGVDFHDEITDGENHPEHISMYKNCRIINDAIV